MHTEPQLHTERLLLRRWRFTDLEPFAAMNADPDVMEHFPSLLSTAESAALIERAEGSFDRCGYGLWAVELARPGVLVGCVGLQPLDIDVEFAPAVEVLWRLARPYWGDGLATEAAAASISYGFDEIGLTEIVAYTAVVNKRSRRVMARLGMLRDDTEDFIHPALARDHPLAPHVLYRMDAARWIADTPR